MATKCMHCGSTKFGPGCPSSTDGLHKHNTDARHCMYCGSSSYGNGCLQTPTRKHKHNHGDGKCIYCGEIPGANQAKCKHAPNGQHET
jgi:hypothetical protein